MYFYKAFGINIKSELMIPPFESAEDYTADVVIKLGEVRHLLPLDKQYGHIFQSREGEVFFYWEQIGWFLVRDGKEVIIEPIVDAEEKLVQLPLVGVVLAVLFQQRGKLVLHASAVSVFDEAVIFVGWKGQGKSTTAAMMYERGHPMISDDIVLLEKNNGNFYIIPGFPNFKVTPETASQILGDNPLELSEIYTGAGKMFRSSSNNFQKKPILIKSICSLEDGAEVQLKQLKPQESLPILIANTYSARYSEHLLQNNQAILNFRQCADVINQVPVFRLERPKSFDKIKKIAELFEGQY